MTCAEFGLGVRGSEGGGSEWVSAAAASAAVDLVEGGGVKRRRVRLSSSVESDDGVDVIDFGCGGWAFDGDELEGSPLGNDVDEAGEGVGADTGLLAVGVPVVGLGDGGDLGGELLEVGVVDVGWLVFAMQDGNRVGDAGDEAVDGETVVGDVDAVVVGIGEVFL